MTQELSNAWDHHAETYGRLFAPLTGFIARSMFTLVAPRLAPGAALLDIACGTGALTVPAVEHALRLRATSGRAGTVTATDFSPEMVALTRRAATAVGADGSMLRCEVHDGQALGFKDSSFDAVFSAFGIFLFQDRAAGWREASRVLRPGGTFATSVWQGPATNAMLRAQMEPVARALPERLHQPPPKGGWMDISEAEALRAEVVACGDFEDVRIYPFSATFAVGDWTELWGVLRNNPVMGAVLKRCTDDELASVCASFNDHFRALAGGDDRPLTMDAMCNILVARRA